MHHPLQFLGKSLTAVPKELPSLYSVTAGDCVSPEKKRDTPYPGKTHKGIDKTAEQRTLSAEQPCNQVEPENSHKAPVETADDGKNQCDGIHVVTSISDFG